MGVSSGKAPWRGFLSVASTTFFTIALCLATDSPHSREYAPSLISNSGATTSSATEVAAVHAGIHKHKRQGDGGGGGGGGGEGGGGGGGGGGGRGGGGGGGGGGGRGGWGYGWGWGGMGGGGGGGGGSGGDVNGGCWWRCEEGGEEWSGGRYLRHGGRGGRGDSRPSYSSSLYRVGEYASCSERGRCGGMSLLCPMHCNGPCFYDCQSNCRAHCLF